MIDCISCKEKPEWGSTGEEDEKYDLSISRKMRFSEHRSERERDRNLMNSNTCENTHAKSFIERKTSPYAETIKECMDKNSYPRDENNVIVMFVGVFVCMSLMIVIMSMRRQYFFEEVYKEKTCYKGINRKTVLRERFG